MIPVILQKGIEPVAAAKPMGGGRDEALRYLLQLAPGQLVSARIEARLPDGSFKVAVAGQELRMTLPAQVSVGDRLELAFVAHDPRPRFALQQRTAGAPLLSAAGRLVAAMLPQPGAPAMVSAAPAAAPLLAALPADGAALATALEHTLAQSGLFYEAHQADWVAGKHELTQLRAEPQARQAPGTPQLQAPPAASIAANLSAATETSGAAPRAEQLLQAQAPPLLQQQLAALESGRIVLQLEIWPRQWMQWAVEEHAEHAAREPDAPSSWQTRLRLDLPQLGALDAVLTLGGDGVQIKLDASNAASATLMQDHRAALHAALDAAGVLAAAIAIAHHEQA